MTPEFNLSVRFPQMFVRATPHPIENRISLVTGIKGLGETFESDLVEELVDLKTKAVSQALEQLGWISPHFATRARDIAGQLFMELSRRQAHDDYLVRAKAIIECLSGRDPLL